VKSWKKRKKRMRREREVWGGSGQIRDNVRGCVSKCIGGVLRGSESIICVQ